MTHSEPWRLQMADQQWSAVNKKLNEVLESIRGDESFVAAVAGGADESRIFDYIYTVVKIKDRSEPGAVLITEALCAAALTRLARVPRAEDPLAHLEKEMTQDDDHN